MTFTQTPPPGDAPAGHPPLRVGLLLDSLSVPGWVSSTIEEIQASPVANIVLVLLNGRSRRERPIHPAYREGRDPRRFDRLYLFLEDLAYKVSPDATGRRSAEAMLADVERITVEPRYQADHFTLEGDALGAARSRKLDVALLFGFGLPSPGILSIARYGIWSHKETELAATGASPLGLAEVLEGAPVTVSSLLARAADAPHPVTLYRSSGMTDHRIVKRSRNFLLWKTSRFAGRKLRELARERPDSISELGTRCAEGDGCGGDRRLSNLEVVKLASKNAISFLHGRYSQLFAFQNWTIGYRLPGNEGAYPGSLSKYRILLPPGNMIWADPFPFRKDGRNYIFFEEMAWPAGKGRVRVIEVDENGIKAGPDTVLEREHHLSYPFLFEWEGRLYMIPESFQAERIEVYRCDEFPGRWSHHAVLLEGVNAVDTTLIERDGLWWMFTNIDTKGSWNVEELHLFFSDNPFGPWKPHRDNPVVSDVRSSRPAGKLFYRGRKLCRPAQDCSKGYGHAIRIFEVRTLTPECYEEEEVEVIWPGAIEGALGIHTLNQHEGLAVIDAKRWRRKSRK
jgi:hypothetical protein